MSATVTTTYARTPIADVLDSKTIRSLSDGDHRKRLPLMAQPAGQLWERVAERIRPNYDVYPWKALDAVEHFHSSAGRPVCIAGLGFKGTLGRHVCGDHYSHGIIRAGERIK